MHPGVEPLMVPPGFRFHPTDEELLYYYLRKKVAYEAIDLDVIREIDLNKLEPWDLIDRCRIGTGPQDEWYFFSHKDKKYPTGTRTNRATAAGFWKATGRDKAILLSNGPQRIGLRKTLVFYTGRAPHGTKTDWIMHEYRLDDDNADAPQPEDGWVVCRVFKKKSIQRGYEQPDMAVTELQSQLFHVTPDMAPVEIDQKHGFHQLMHGGVFPTFDPSMHLPQLTSAETTPGVPSFMSLSGTQLTTPHVAVNQLDLGCSHSQSRDMRKLAPCSGGGNGEMLLSGGDRFGAATDWSILDKLLESHQNLDQLFHGKLGGTLAVGSPPPHQHHYQQQQQLKEIGASSLQRLPFFHYLGCEAAELLKFSK